MEFTTATRPSELWAGLKGFWEGMAKEENPIYPRLFNIENSTQKYEKFSEHYDVGLVPEKAEGAASKFGSFAQGSQPEFNHVAYSLGIILTHESIKDNLYFRDGKDKVRALRKSFLTTKEIKAANVLNNGFTAGYVMPNGDGQTLFSTSHPNNIGTYSNKLSVAADLAESTLEDMLIQIKGTYDSSGVHKANLKGKKLWVSDNDLFTACRILKSYLQNDSANNAVNAVKALGVLPEGYETNTYFSDTDAWFVTTNIERGLLLLQREPLEFYDDNEKTTRNFQYFGYERYSLGWVDPRGVFGTEGA